MDTSDARQLVQDLRRRYTDSSRHEAAFIERVAVTLIALADEVDRLNAELHNYKAAAAEEARFADECENRVSDLNDDLDSDNAIIKHLDSHVRRLTQENERLRQACEAALDQLSDGISTDPERVMQQLTDSLAKAKQETSDGNHTYRQPGSNVFQTIGDYAWLWFPLGSIVVNLSLLAWMAWNVIEKLLGH